MLTTIEYRNTFHNTACRVRVDSSLVADDPQEGLQARLSKSQIARVYSTLCGMGGCRCGSHQDFTESLDYSGWCRGGRIAD